MRHIDLSEQDLSHKADILVAMILGFNEKNVFKYYYVPFSIDRFYKCDTFYQ
jgi:hypothetical protein